VAGQDEDDDIVTGIVLMRRGENPAVVLKAVHNSIDQLNTSGLPGGVKVVPFYDRTWLIGKTLTTSSRTCWKGRCWSRSCCGSSWETSAPRRSWR